MGKRVSDQELVEWLAGEGQDDGEVYTTTTTNIAMFRVRMVWAGYDDSCCNDEVVNECQTIPTGTGVKG